MKRYYLSILGIIVVLLAPQLPISIFETFYVELNRFWEYIYPMYNLSFRIIGIFLMIAGLLPEKK